MGHHPRKQGKLEHSKTSTRNPGVGIPVFAGYKHLDPEFLVDVFECSSLPCFLGWWSIPALSRSFSLFLSKIDVRFVPTVLTVAIQVNETPSSLQSLFLLGCNAFLRGPACAYQILGCCWHSASVLPLLCS